MADFCHERQKLEDVDVLRARYRAKRSALSPDERAAFSRRICKRLLNWDAFEAAQTVMAYVPRGAEADVRPVLEAALARGKTLLLPRCAQKGVIEAATIAALGALEPDAYGIPSPPRAARAENPETVDLVLVPGVAFDARGNRLGQGGGCYDRFLPRCRGVVCGVAFSVQVTDALPARPHDAPVGWLATEKELLKFV